MILERQGRGDRMSRYLHLIGLEDKLKVGVERGGAEGNDQVTASGRWVCGGAIHQRGSIGKSGLDGVR